MAMEAEESQQPKWEGEACAELTGVTADQVWHLLEDFFNVHKWLPTVDRCEQVEGVSGQPGCIRYRATTTAVSSGSGGGGGEETVLWLKEKLVAIDPMERCFSYDVIDDNIGLNSYVTTIKVVPAEKVDGKAKQGCKIKWAFVSDPFEGWGGFEGLLSYVDSSLQAMAERMEEALSSK